MKVLLISQPNIHAQKPDFPPIGIAYLGAVISKEGHQTMLIDAALSTIGKIVKKAKEFSPDVIGITCWTIGRKAVWQLCDVLEKEMPEVFVALGGPHATLFPEHVFKKTYAKAVVLGEGEDTFKELLSNLSRNEDLKNVRGLALPDKGGKVFFTGKRDPVKDLDNIPDPYYEGFNNFKFSDYGGLAALPGPTAPVISSRGCVYDCTYCGSVKFWGNCWRYRSAENILNELEQLKDKWKVRSLYFFDDNFPVNKKRLIKICKGMIERNLSLTWACCSHVKMLDHEMLMIMKQSGCVSIDFGVESGSNRILKNINKKQTREDIEKTFALVHEVGINPRAYLMVGNKGEDEKTIDQTIDLIGKIKPYSSIGATILWLLPGTAVYDEALRNGYMSDDFWLNCDDVPYNLQEKTYEELFKLRKRLMFGIARNKGVFSLLSYFLRSIYYKYPQLSFLRSVIPKKLR